MGFYLRKYFKLGPIRLNLSKSGISPSIGVKGLRFGIGARGSYIHAGRNGLYFRQNLMQNNDHAATKTDNSDFLTSDIKSEVGEAQNELELLLNQTQSKPSFSWLSIPIGLSFIIFSSGIISIAGIILSMIIYFTLNYYDKRRKTIEIHCTTNIDMENAFYAFKNAMINFNKTSDIWIKTGESKFNDPKYNAGTNNIIDRIGLNIREWQPKYTSCTIKPLMLWCKNFGITFYPDKIICNTGNVFVVFDYKSILFLPGKIKYIENQSVGKNSKIVGWTWQFVNKLGGPDLRFKNNKKLPICQYETIDISHNEETIFELLLSKSDSGNEFIDILNCLQHLNIEKTTTPNQKQFKIVSGDELSALLEKIVQNSMLELEDPYFRNPIPTGNELGKSICQKVQNKFQPEDFHLLLETITKAMESLKADAPECTKTMLSASIDYIESSSCYLHNFQPNTDD